MTAIQLSGPELEVWAAEEVEAKRMEKEASLCPLLRTVAVATAGKRGAKWDFSPVVAADALLSPRLLALDQIGQQFDLVDVAVHGIYAAGQIFHAVEALADVVALLGCAGADVGSMACTFSSKNTRADSVSLMGTPKNSPKLEKPAAGSSSKKWAWARSVLFLTRRKMQSLSNSPTGRGLYLKNWRQLLLLSQQAIFTHEIAPVTKLQITKEVHGVCCDSRDGANKKIVAHLPPQNCGFAAPGKAAAWHSESVRTVPLPTTGSGLGH